MENLNFGQAIEALREGKLVARREWDDKIFVVKQVPATIGLDVIPKMQSLPQDAKDVMVERGIAIRYTDQMLIVNLDAGRWTDRAKADSWLPSSSDVFAEDWFIFR